MNKTVLVVDDNRLILEFMVRVISDQGYTVTTATDGFEALDRLSDLVPDVIFVDLIMPKIQGDTLCRIIRKMPHLDSSYLVVISAAAAEMDIEFDILGANACIAKGAFNTMARNIHQVLEEAALEDLSRGTPTPKMLGLEDLQPREMTKELLSRNRHLAGILENISDGIVETFSGRVVYANAAAQYLLAASIETISGATFASLFGPDDQESIARLLEADDGPGSSSAGAVTVTLGRRSVVVRKLSISADSDTTALLITDVTEKREAEKALQAAQRRIEALEASQSTASPAANAGDE
jgi:CheY-like chemotaxis protein